MEMYEDLFQKLIPGLVNIYDNRPVKIILYGSVARGTQTDESDIDIAVIIPQYSQDEYNQMIEFIVDLELEYNQVLSVYLIDSKKFAEWEDILPFYKNVKEEGIVLWPTSLWPSPPSKNPYSNISLCFPSAQSSKKTHKRCET